MLLSLCFSIIIWYIIKEIDYRKHIFIELIQD